MSENEISIRLLLSRPFLWGRREPGAESRAGVLFRWNRPCISGC